MGRETMGVRRLMREAQELAAEASDEYEAGPLEDNLYEWHFALRGPADSEYEEGIYHGRLIMPADFPLRPPEVYMLTPSGRFETNSKICLSISSMHPESWQPSWGVRTALVALRAFFATDPMGAAGSLSVSAEERRRLARCSRGFSCAKCGWAASAAMERLEAGQRGPVQQVEQVESGQIESGQAGTGQADAGQSDTVQADTVQIDQANPRHLESGSLATPVRTSTTSGNITVVGTGVRGRPARAATAIDDAWIDRAIVLVLMALVGLVVQLVSN